jgi:predicted chitinase
MNYMIKKYELTNERRQAHFLAQIFYESDHFRTTTEYHSGSNYDITVNRERAKGLGNTEPGDGKRFRG